MSERVMANWNNRRLERRAKHGDGRQLKPFRWWQLTRRSLLSIVLPEPGSDQPLVHTIEVKHGGDVNTGIVMARLYVQGRLTRESRMPARFTVPGGHIEVRRSEAGLRRCHFVAHDGTERLLTPDPSSAEGRRARFARTHPRASALIGRLSIIMMLVGVGLNLPQLVEALTRIPPVAEVVGTFTSPLQLPLWLNISLGVSVAVAATERALRFRYHWLLDSGGAS